MSSKWIGRGLITVATAGLLAAGPAASAVPKDIAGAGNRAVIDPAATAAVLKRANGLCEQLFSYDYTTIDEYEGLVEELTVDEFTDEFQDQYGNIEEQAVSRQLVLRSTVATSAVRQLGRDRAQVLVYLDQSTTAAGSQQNQGGAMFLTSLRRVDGEWLVADITTYEVK